MRVCAARMNVEPSPKGSRISRPRAALGRARILHAAQGGLRKCSLSLRTSGVDAWATLDKIVVEAPAAVLSNYRTRTIAHLLADVRVREGRQDQTGR